jgi:dihydroneopterin aldolase/D-erythro-7,8-dihydroneopterin triphosphate epimerase
MAASDGHLDRIHIRDLALRCIIGIEPHERDHRQDVLINITLHADLRKAGQSDRIEDTVNYKTIKRKVVDLVENSSFLLVEKLAQRIADVCLTEPGVQRVEVTLEKPGALRFARNVAVEITREQPNDG